MMSNAPVEENEERRSNGEDNHGAPVSSCRISLNLELSRKPSAFDQKPSFLFIAEPLVSDGIYEINIAPKARDDGFVDLQHLKDGNKYVR